MDTSIISKIELGDRQLQKEQIPLLAEIPQVGKEKLEILGFADQLMQLLKK